MTYHRGIFVVLAPLLAFTTIVAISPTAAYAASCSPSKAGKKKYTTSGKKFDWVIAQKTREENYSGKTATLTFEVSKGKTKKNSVKISSSAKAKVSAMWSSFEASVSADMGSSSSSTSFAKTTRKYSLKSGDSYLFGQGTGKWTATGTVYQCRKVNANGDGYQWFKIGSGPLTGYTGLTRSVIGCKQKPSATSFAAKLKRSC